MSEKIFKIETHNSMPKDKMLIFNQGKIEAIFDLQNETARDTKCVLVMRTDLGMRRGKQIAQAGHGFVIAYQYFTEYYKFDDVKEDSEAMVAFKVWKNGMYKKICVGVPSLDELFALGKKAQDLGIYYHFVVDNGLTEFKGEQTITCGVFGPTYSDKLDLITGHLKLL